MTKNRSAIIDGVALLLVLSVLAYSFSGEIDLVDDADGVGDPTDIKPPSSC
jgi:hypothetical protein